MEGTHPEVITTKASEPPSSVVAFLDNGERKIEHPPSAKQSPTQHARLSSVKRVTWVVASSENDPANTAYNVVTRANDVLVKVDDHTPPGNQSNDPQK
jgi:hypothetical protein